MEKELQLIYDEEKKLVPLKKFFIIVFQYALY